VNDCWKNSVPALLGLIYVHNSSECFAARDYLACEHEANVVKSELDGAQT